MLRYLYRIFTLMIAFLLCFKQNKSTFFGGPWGLQCSIDPQLSFYMSLACLFLILQKTDVPIFFLYYPLSTYTNWKNQPGPNTGFNIVSFTRVTNIVIWDMQRFTTWPWKPMPRMVSNSPEMCILIPFPCCPAIIID